MTTVIDQYIVNASNIASSNLPDETICNYLQNVDTLPDQDVVDCRAESGSGCLLAQLCLSHAGCKPAKKARPTERDFSYLARQTLKRDGRIASQRNIGNPMKGANST